MRLGDLLVNAESVSDRYIKQGTLPLFRGQTFSPGTCFNVHTSQPYDAGWQTIRLCTRRYTVELSGELLHYAYRYPLTLWRSPAFSCPINGVCKQQRGRGSAIPPCLLGAIYVMNNMVGNYAYSVFTPIDSPNLWWLSWRGSDNFSGNRKRGNTYRHHGSHWHRRCRFLVRKISLHFSCQMSSHYISARRMTKAARVWRNTVGLTDGVGVPRQRSTRPLYDRHSFTAHSSYRRHFTTHTGAECVIGI
jgi:hypothetical protein